MRSYERRHFYLPLSKISLFDKIKPPVSAKSTVKLLVMQVSEEFYVGLKLTDYIFINIYPLMTAYCTEYNYNNPLPGNGFLRKLQETVCFVYSCIIEVILRLLLVASFSYHPLRLLRLFNFRHENEDEDVRNARKALNAALM